MSVEVNGIEIGTLVTVVTEAGTGPRIGGSLVASVAEFTVKVLVSVPPWPSSPVTVTVEVPTPEESRVITASEVSWTIEAEVITTGGLGELF